MCDSGEAKVLRIKNRMLTVTDVSHKLSVRNSWVYTHAAEMGAVKMLGLLRFPEDKLDAWIDAQSLASEL
jgi:predicted DNA-binding transcriptional regulator AlpA